MANAFSNLGATPVKVKPNSSISASWSPTISQSQIPKVSTTPVNRPTIGTTAQTTPGLLNSQPKVTPNSPIQSSWGQSSGLLNNSPAPSTPIKATTQNNVDGSSTKTEYHAEAKPSTTASPTSSGYMSGSNAVPQNQPTNPNGIFGNSNVNPSPTPYTPQTSQGTYISDLASRSQQPNPAYQAQMDEANRISNERKNLENEFRNKSNNIQQTAGFLTQAGGEQGLLQNQYNTGIAALSQQGADVASRLSAANTQQQTQNSALSSAITANAPQFPGYQTPVYSPSQGFVNGGSAFTGGQKAGEAGLGQQYAQNLSANNQAQAVKSSIANYIAQNPTLNPSAFSDVNSVVQLLSGKVSDPRYQVLSNMLAEYVNTLTPILGVGGDSTNLKTQIAQGMINGRQSGQSIVDVLNGIEQLATTKLNAQQNAGQGTQQSAPVTMGDTQFYQDSNGVWQYK